MAAGGLHCGVGPIYALTRAGLGMLPLYRAGGLHLTGGLGLEWTGMSQT